MKSSNFELLVHFWHEIAQLNKCITDFINIYKKNFKIKNIKFDFENINIYKNNMKAIKTGIIPKNRYVQFDINIVNKSSSIINEIVNKDLLNINSLTNQYMIKIGMGVITYITDSR